MQIPHYNYQTQHVTIDLNNNNMKATDDFEAKNELKNGRGYFCDYLLIEVG